MSEAAALAVRPPQFDVAPYAARLGAALSRQAGVIGMWFVEMGIAGQLEFDMYLCVAIREQDLSHFEIAGVLAAIHGSTDIAVTLAFIDPARTADRDLMREIIMVGTPISAAAPAPAPATSRQRVAA